MDPKLYKQLSDLISDDKYDVNDLMNLLEPIGKIEGNDTFEDGINSIVDSLTKDRNGDNVFTIDDLKMLSSDVVALTGLISSVVLVLSGIPSINTKSISSSDLEQLVFKVLVYVFLVVVPKETGVYWTLEDRTAILNLCIVIYQVMLSSHIVGKTLKFLKKEVKKLCACLRSSHSSTVAVEMEKNASDVKMQMQKNRDVISLEKRVQSLENA